MAPANGTFEGPLAVGVPVLVPTLPRIHLPQVQRDLQLPRTRVYASLLGLAPGK